MDGGGALLCTLTQVPPPLSVQISLGVSGFHPPAPEGTKNLHFPDITPRQLYFAQSLSLFRENVLGIGTR